MPVPVLGSISRSPHRRDSFWKFPVLHPPAVLIHTVAGAILAWNSDEKFLDRALSRCATATTSPHHPRLYRYLCRSMPRVWPGSPLFFQKKYFSTGTGNRVFGWESLRPKRQQPMILSAFKSRLRSGQSWAGVAMDPAANCREQLREWAWQSRLSIPNLNDSSSSADTGSGNLRAFEWCHACGDASCLARMLRCCLALAVAVSSVSVTSCAGAVLAPNTSQRISRLQHHEQAGEYCRRASSSNQHYILYHALISTSPSKPPGGLQRQCCVVHSSFKLFTGAGNYHS